MNTRLLKDEIASLKAQKRAFYITCFKRLLIKHEAKRRVFLIANGVN
jgi:hypothetical protein